MAEAAGAAICSERRALFKISAAKTTCHQQSRQCCCQGCHAWRWFSLTFSHCGVASSATILQMPARAIASKTTQQSDCLCAFSAYSLHASACLSISDGGSPRLSAAGCQPWQRMLMKVCCIFNPIIFTAALLHTEDRYTTAEDSYLDSYLNSIGYLGIAYLKIAHKIAQNSTR